MASKRHRRPPTGQTPKPRKDRVVAARKAELLEMTAKEAEMEARTLGAVRRVAVVCANCQTRSEFPLDNRVPVAMCPQCGQRLPLRADGGPHVVSR